MQILITGFPAFPGQPLNPTQELVEAILARSLGVSDFPIAAVLLPVEYRQVEVQIDEILDRLQPDLVLSFGVGRHDQTLRLESLGVNLDSATIPDNAGELRTNQRVVRDGPAEIRSEVDLNSLAETLSRNEIPVEISENAGRYVCNHLLYYASYQQRKVTKRYEFLFTHVPTHRNGFDLPITLKGIETMVDWFARQRSV